MLSSNAVVAKINIRCFTAQRVDRNASAEVANNHNVGSEVGRFTKNLFGAKCPELTQITNIAQSARLESMMYSLAWGRGERLVPTGDALFTFMEKMKIKKQAFDKAVNDFEARYQDLKEAAKVKLGTLYNEMDYPASVSGLFEFSITFTPVPDANAFDNLIGTQIAEDMKYEYEKSLNDSLRNCRNSLKERIEEALSHSVECLENYGNNPTKFMSSWVTKPVEIADICKTLNITNDQYITNWSNRIVQLYVRPVDFKVDAADRYMLVTEAKNILEEIKNDSY